MCWRYVEYNVSAMSEIKSGKVVDGVELNRLAQPMRAVAAVDH